MVTNMGVMVGEYLDIDAAVPFPVLAVEPFGQIEPARRQPRPCTNQRRTAGVSRLVWTNERTMDRYLDTSRLTPTVRPAPFDGRAALAKRLLVRHLRQREEVVYRLDLLLLLIGLEK